MIAKLIKYEWKASAKWFLTISGVSLLVSLFSGLWFRHMTSISTGTTSTLSSVITLVFALILIALFLTLGFGSAIIIVRRFYKSTFGREGYLTLTLPVSTHQLLLAKTISATIFLILSSLVTVLSIFFMFGIASREEFGTIFETISGFLPADFGPVLVISLIVGSFAQAIKYYLAIAIGQLFQNRRVLAAILFYIALEIVLYAVGMMLSIYAPMDFTVFFTSAAQGETINSSFLWFDTGMDIFYSLIFYGITHYILKNKVNIQ